MEVTLWWHVAAASFRSQWAYLKAAAAGLFTNTIFALIRTAIALQVLAANGGVIAGVGAALTMANIWITQALLSMINFWGLPQLGPRIRTGQVALDLTRPVNILGFYTAQEIGLTAFQLVPRFIPPVAIGAVFFGGFWVIGLDVMALGVVSLILAVLTSAAIRLIVCITGFWTTEVRGVHIIMVSVTGLLSGLMIPLWWMPQWLQTVCYFTPFPATVQMPADVMTGRIRGADAIVLIAQQAFWACAMYTACVMLLRRARTYLVISGG